MSNILQDIHDLINTTGKAAPDMTKALKKIGGGDMQKGIKKLADFFSATGCEKGINQGIRLGEKRGWVKGSLTTLGVVSLAAGGLYLKDKYAEYKRKKALEQEGQEILEAIKSTVQTDAINNEEVDDNEQEDTVD